MRLLPLLSLLLLLLAGPVPAERDLESDLATLKSRISSLKKELDKVRSERDRLQQSLQQAELEIGKLDKDIHTLSTQLSHLRQTLIEQSQQQKALQEQLAQQQQQVKQQIASAYRFGQQSQIKLLLNLEDPVHWSRTSRYHRYLLDARSEKIAHYLKTVDDIRQVTAHIEENTARLQTTQDQLRAQKKQLSSRQQQRQSTLSQLEGELSSKDKQLAELVRNRAQLEKLLNEVSEALANLPSPADAQPFRQRKGSMTLPVKGRVLKRFGQSRVAGKLNWEGVLIAANSGDEVQAIHHGRVVFSDYLRGHGLLLIIDHGEGFMSLYAHNQSLLKETGQWVNTGENIARAGNSGGLDRSALYFEIRHKGQPVNPTRWCQ